mmetsp:Transcript_17033/g.59614  ORF Transcript_17033/g.59614 Transcript_17033/m.59614 type:complete len:302 (-) Transcript_17033:188-1093(-)
MAAALAFLKDLDEIKKNALLGFGSAACVMLVWGLYVHHWTGGAVAGAAAAAPPPAAAAAVAAADTTFWSWISALILAVACAAFAYLAPQGDEHVHFTRSFQISFGLEAFIWLVICIHLKFSSAVDALPKVLIDTFIMLVLPTVVGVMQAYCALCCLHNAGFLGDKKKLAIRLSVVTCILLIFLVVVKVRALVAVPLGVVLFLRFGVGALGITAAGVMVQNYPFPIASLVFNVLVIVVLLVKPKPFEASDIFNVTALSHTLSLFNAILVYLSLSCLIEKQTLFSKLEGLTETKVKGRWCCNT